jgi:hypothetical protein
LVGNIDVALRVDCRTPRQLEITASPARVPLGQELRGRFGRC